MTSTGTPDTGYLPSGWWAAGLLPAEHTDVMPTWAATAERVATAAAPVPLPPGATGVLTLAPAVEPFVTDAAAGLAALLPDDGRTGIPAEVLTAGLAEALRGRLARTAARTLVQELHRASERGDLTATDPGARFDQFTAAVATVPGMGALLTAYPVLARLLGQIRDQEVRAAAELAARFAADRRAVVDRLLGGTDPGPVVAVAIGAGDRHAGGRAVAVLRFADGSRVVYKPRPVTLHHRFAELLAVLDDAAPGLAPRAAATQPGPGYGWVEFIPHRTCDTDAELERFYRRQGALLALLHALDATDAHCENVIACGDQPVLVDVETLLHPTPPQPGPVGDDPAMRAISASVQRTAVLPRPILGEHGSFDLSALGGGAGCAPDPGVRVEDAGTDRMRIVRGRVRYDGGESGPTLRGVAADPTRHRADILAGFRAAYDIVRGSAATLLAADGPLHRCAAEPVRFVVRDTAGYARLLDESTHPDLLRTATDRDEVLGVVAEDAPFPALVRHELADLWSGDIPLFTVRPDSRDVWSAHGARTAGVLDEPVIDGVRRKLTEMGPADSERQEWMIRATLALADTGVGHAAVTGRRRAGCAPASPARLLAAACAVGDQVVALAEHDARRANWVGVQRVEDRFWAVLPLGAGLGDGYLGVALFLAQLGSVTGIPRYTDLARRAVEPLPRLLAAMADPGWAETVGCGAFSGLGGISYALARLATLLDDPAPATLLPAAIDATVAAAGPADRAGQDLSVDTGLAGGLAALQAVRAETGLGGPAAAALADRLHRLAGPTGAPGFLRGDTGVDWALRRAGLPGTADPAGTDAGPGWCSAATGALLAAIDTDTPRADTDLAAALADLAAGVPLAGHSLCHGESGVLDALAEPTAAGTRWHARGAQLLAALADGGPLCATPDGLPTPGLLGGLSGIGHTLLRLAHPDQVPSVLLLRPSPGRPLSPLSPVAPSCAIRPGPDVRTGSAVPSPIPVEDR